MNCTYDDKGTVACKQGERRIACGREGGTSNTHNKKKKYSEAQTARKYGRIRHKEKGKAEEREIVCFKTDVRKQKREKKRQKTEADQRNLRVRRRGAVQEVTLRAWETCTQE